LLVLTKPDDYTAISISLILLLLTAFRIDQRRIVRDSGSMDPLWWGSGFFRHHRRMMLRNQPLIATPTLVWPASNPASPSGYGSVAFHRIACTRCSCRSAWLLEKSRIHAAENR